MCVGGGGPNATQRTNTQSHTLARKYTGNTQFATTDVMTATPRQPNRKHRSYDGSRANSECTPQRWRAIHANRCALVNHIQYSMRKWGALGQTTTGGIISTWRWMAISALRVANSSQTKDSQENTRGKEFNALQENDNKREHESDQCALGDLLSM